MEAGLLELFALVQQPVSSSLANLGGAWRRVRLNLDWLSGISLHPSGTGTCEKSGDAPVGPSVSTILPAHDGHAGCPVPALERGPKHNRLIPADPPQLAFLTTSQMSSVIEKLAKVELNRV